MKIVVSGNCQTAGIAAALRALTTAREVVALPLGEPAEVLRGKLQAQLGDADVFVHSTGNNVARELAAQARPGLQRMAIPVLHFNGFHPDICYAWHKDSKRLTEPHYNSAIAVWAYAHGLDLEQTAALYTPEVFAALGYFDAWRLATEALRKAFTESDLGARFADFFLHAKRRGCFMHTLNHPRVDTINHLARLIAEQLQLPLQRNLGPSEINDGLNSVIWPVYPAIADALGLDGGSYCWKFIGRQRYVDGLDDYLAQACAAYAEQGIAPAQLAITYQGTQTIDRVLGAATGR